MTTGVSLGAALWASRHYLAARRNYFTDDFDKLPLTLPRSLLNTAVVTGVGTGLGFAYASSRHGLQRYFGPGITKNVLARTTNAALWSGAGVTGLYWAGISYVGRSNEKVDPGYDTPPTSPLVSGLPESLAPFDELGQQGRRYVLDAPTAGDLINIALFESFQIDHRQCLFDTGFHLSADTPSIFRP